MMTHSHGFVRQTCYPLRFIDSVKAAVTSILFPVVLLIAQGAQGQTFGNGVHGAAVINGSVTLSYPRNYTDLTVMPGAVLSTHGYTVRVSGTLLNYGRITDSYSGGLGGPYGFGARGGYGANPHHSPNYCFPIGLEGGPPQVMGAGGGGYGGIGGSGGGGAWDDVNIRSADGGDGGDGGYGGHGGGYVVIYAFNLDNQGTIDADGMAGSPGEPGSNGGYDSYLDFLSFSPRDLAGGGGGGGKGGNGGKGGSVKVWYDRIIHQGTIRAVGGAGGAGSSGGNGQAQSYAANVRQHEEAGALAWYGAGAGGASATGTSSSQNGDPGEAGSSGSPGTVTISHCCPSTNVRGDFALPLDGVTDGSDLGVCVDYIFFGVTSVVDNCLSASDVNNDGLLDGGDLGILVDYIFFNDTSVIKRCDGSPF